MRRYICGVDHVELIGDGNANFICYVNKIGPDGEPYRDLCEEIVVPIDQIPDCVMKACTAASLSLMGNALVLLH